MSRIIFSIYESESRWVVSDSLQPHGLYSPWKYPGQNTGMEGIFPTQGWNPGLPLYRQILYQLSLKGSPRILKWVAYSFSSGSSQPRNPTGVPCIAGRFFTNWVMRETLSIYIDMQKKIAKRNILYFNQVVLNWGQFCSPPSQRTFDNSWRYFWLSQKEAWALLASSGQRPGMLPNMTQCTG